MGLYGYGVVFYGWHFRLELLKDKFPQIKESKWFDNYSFEVTTSTGKSIKMNIEEQFTDQWYDEVIFGKVYVRCETFRNFQIEKIPIPTQTEMEDIKEVFIDFELDATPKLLLTGLGVC